MALGKALQRFERTDYLEEIGTWISGGIVLWQCVHNKVSHSSTIKVGYELMAIATAGLEGKEQRFLRETEGTAVGEQKADVGGLVSISTRPYQCRYFFN